MKKLLLLTDSNQERSDLQRVYSDIVEISSYYFNTILVFENLIELNIKGKKGISISHKSTNGLIFSIINSSPDFFKTNFFDKKYYLSESLKTTAELETYLAIRLPKKIRMTRIIRVKLQDMGEAYKIMKKNLAKKEGTLIIDTAMNCESAFKKKHFDFDYFFIFLNRNKGCYTEFIHSTTKHHIKNGVIKIKEEFESNKIHQPNSIAVVNEINISLPFGENVFFGKEEGCIFLEKKHIKNLDDLEKALKTIYCPPEIFISYGNTKYHSNLINSLRSIIQEKLPIADVLIDQQNITLHSDTAEFIERIKNGEHIIIFINDKYIKSDYCIEELQGIYEISKGKADEIKNRIHPYILEDAKYIYKKEEYINEIQKNWIDNKKATINSSTYKFLMLLPDIISRHYNIPENEILNEERIHELAITLERKFIQLGFLPSYSIVQ